MTARTSMLPVAILAGGMATRLGSLTATVPKALLDIGGRPFIWHQLRLLQSNGIGRVVVCVGHLGHLIEQSVRDQGPFAIEVQFRSDGPQLLGTAGALRAALPLLGDAFFVLYGDSYLTCDFRPVERAFLASGRRGLMTVFRNEGRWDQSNVEFAGDRVIAYDKRHQRPGMHYIDYGLGILKADVLQAVPEDEPYDLADVYSCLVSVGELQGYEVSERFYEIGSFEGLEETRGYIDSTARHLGGIA